MIAPCKPPWGSPQSPLGFEAIGLWPVTDGASATSKGLGRKPASAVLNGAGATRVSGAFGPTVHLDGSTGYIESAVPAGVGNGTYASVKATVVVWFRTAAAISANNTFIMGRSTPSGGNSLDGFVVILNPTGGSVGQIRFILLNSAAGVAAEADSAAIGYNDGLWHMVAAQFQQINSTLQQLYVDGRLSGTATSNNTNWALTTTAVVRWGASAASFYGKFNGDIEPGAWFDRWLTAGEIANLWQSGPAGFFRGSALPIGVASAAVSRLSGGGPLLAAS